MADLRQQITMLLDLDPLQRLDHFASMDLETKVAVVNELYADHDLKQVRRVFTQLYPSQLANLLHELDREICELIFDWVGEEQRLSVMLHLHARDITGDLEAAMRVVSADEIVNLLSRLPVQAKREVFRLATAEAQVDVLIDYHDRQCNKEFNQFIAEMDPADIADLLEQISPAFRLRILGLLGKQMQADAIVELKARVALDFIRELPIDRLVGLMELMAADDATDLLAQLQENERESILDAMDPQLRAEIGSLLSYEEDSAGDIMTPELCSVSANATVAETRRALAKITDSDDPIFYVYVVDPEDKSLVGVVPIIRLVNAAPGRKIVEICEKDVIYTTPDEDQEEIARRFRKYDVWVMPVIDDDRRLVGRITVDDVIDVMHEEADEDLARLVGAPDIEDEDESPIRISRKRLPWLMITMFAGLLNAIVIQTITESTGLAILSSLAPSILAMGGNTGMQSSAVCIRGIALGEEKYSNLFAIVWREIRVGLSLGVTCGAIACVTILTVVEFARRWNFILPKHMGDLSPLNVGTVVGVAMFSAMTFASSFGSLTPILLHRMGVDPAVASGPFVTTSSDISAALIYLGTCVAMFAILAA